MPTNRVITNKLDRLERQLKKKLLAFYNAVIAGSLIPIDILRQKYDQKVKDIIRSTAQESYLIGTDRVASAVLTNEKDFQLFISATDLNNITSLTDRLSNDFWTTAQRLQDRENTVDKPNLDAKAALTGIAAAVAFSAFNNAIKSKSTQVTANQQPQLRTVSISPQGITDLEFDVPFEIKPVGRIRFVTKQDSKVDPDICAPLHGTTWFVDDPSIVTPPDDTHRFCRCTLEPVIE